MTAGVYLIGLFVELSEERKNDGTVSNYVTLTTGGRKGVVSVKFPPEKRFFDYFSDKEYPAQIMLKVRPSGFHDSVYYMLEDVVEVS